MQFDLRADFIAQLRADRAIEKIAQASPDWTFEKIAGCVNEAGQLIWCQRAPSATGHEMEADIEVGIFVREGGRFVARCGGDHQAGRGEDAFAMRADDASVDLARIAEIIGGYDDGSRRQ